MDSCPHQCGLSILCLPAIVAGTLAQPSMMLVTLLKESMLMYTVRLMFSTCHFGNFPLSFTFLVKPNLKPYPTSTPVQAMLGSSATLQTLLVNANPMDVTIRWLGPSGDVVADSQYSSFNISNGTVYIVNLMTLTPSSGGVYTCEIENSIGTSNVNFTLLVIGELTCTVVYTSTTKTVNRFMLNLL